MRRQYTYISRVKSPQIVRRGLSEIDPLQTQSNIGPLMHKAYRLVTGAELVFVGCWPKPIVSVAAKPHLE